MSIDDVRGTVKIVCNTPKSDTDKVFGAVVGISADTAAVKLIGRAYITVSIDGITKTIYADYYNGDVQNSVRSVKDIATAARNENNSEYNKYKQVFDLYADK